MWEPQKRAPPGSLRIAVYNVLADAMSDDGFLVRLGDFRAYGTRLGFRGLG